MVADMRLGALDLMVSMLAAGNHRRVAGDVDLREAAAVIVGIKNQRGRRSGKRSARCAYSP
jgi:hypothetical protein